MGAGFDLEEDARQRAAQADLWTSWIAPPPERDDPPAAIAPPVAPARGKPDPSVHDMWLESKVPDEAYERLYGNPYLAPPPERHDSQCLSVHGWRGRWAKLLGKADFDQVDVEEYLKRRRAQDAATTSFRRDEGTSLPYDPIARQRELNGRMLDALTANPLGGLGWGVARRFTDDPEKQVAGAEFAANVGDVGTAFAFQREREGERDPLLGKTGARRSDLLEDARDLEERRGGSGPGALDEGLANRGYRPAPGERTTTREQWWREEHDERTRESIRALDDWSPRAHNADHGADTTKAAQETRVQIGLSPIGRRAPTNRATRFDTREAQLEAVGRARRQVARDAPPPTRRDGAPGIAPYVVGGPVTGYGDGIEVRRDSAGAPIPGRPVEDTGPGKDPNAVVILVYDPASPTWKPMTSYPTNRPVTR